MTSAEILQVLWTSGLLVGITLHLSFCWFGMVFAWFKDALRPAEEAIEEGVQDA